MYVLQQQQIPNMKRLENERKKEKRRSKCIDNAEIEEAQKYVKAKRKIGKPQ
jgi:hypothetical protein